MLLTPSEIGSALAAGPNAEPPNAANTMVWDIRLPRALACLLVGGILGLVGSAYQALFRNPLADPFIVGTSSGAAVGGSIALWLGISQWLGGLGLLVCSFLTALGSLALVLALGTRRGFLDTQRLLLSGVVTGSLLSSLTALVLLVAGEDTNKIFRWLMGSTTPMYWRLLTPLAIALILGAAWLYLQTRKLNAFAMGEDTAKRLGVNTSTLKPAILICGAGMTAVAVGTVGIIGFLGLVAPHIARRVVGVDWRYSLIGSGLVGMALLCLADILAQWALPGREISVGIVAALIGAPALLVLLRRDEGVEA